MQKPFARTWGEAYRRQRNRLQSLIKINIVYYRLNSPAAPRPPFCEKKRGTNRPGSGFRTRLWASSNDHDEGRGTSCGIIQSQLLPKDQAGSHRPKKAPASQAKHEYDGGEPSPLSRAASPKLDPRRLWLRDPRGSFTRIRSHALRRIAIINGY